MRRPLRVPVATRCWAEGGAGASSREPAAPHRSGARGPPGCRTSQGSLLPPLALGREKRRPAAENGSPACRGCKRPGLPPAPRSPSRRTLAVRGQPGQGPPGLCSGSGTARGCRCRRCQARSEGQHICSASGPSWLSFHLRHPWSPAWTRATPAPPRAFPRLLPPISCSCPFPSHPDFLHRPLWPSTLSASPLTPHPSPFPPFSLSRGFSCFTAARLTLSIASILRPAGAF